MNSHLKQIIIIGDSGVYGWGDLDAGGWCERLRRKWLKIEGAPIIYPLGVRGDGLEKAAKRCRSEWQCRGELRRKVPDAILLSVGLNDTARIGSQDGRHQLSSDAFRFVLEQLLTELQKDTNVMVMGLTAVNESAMPFADCLWYTNKSISTYESKIEESCLELNVPFLPIHKAMINEPDFTNWIEPDGIHLNAEGHRWLFKRIIGWSSFMEWAQLEGTKNLTPSYN